WLKTFDTENLSDLLSSFLEPPPLYLRINTIKIAVEKLKKEFRNLNIGFRETIIPELICLDTRLSLRELYGYQEGFWYVQDLGSAMVSRVLKPDKEQNIIDFCCFPGGKTAHLAALMENTGKILAI